MIILTTLDLNDRQFLKIKIDPYGRPLLYWRVVQMKPRNRFSSALRPVRTLKREIRVDVWERLLLDERSIPAVVAARVSNVISDARTKWRKEDGIL